MVKNAKTLIGAGVIVVIGIVLIVLGLAIPGVIVALAGVGALFYVLRLPSEAGAEYEDEDEDEAPAPRRRSSTTVAEPAGESLSSWEPEGSLSTWDADEGGLSTWEAEESTSSWGEDEGAELTWEAEESTSLSWDGSEEVTTVDSFETEESYDTFDALTFGEEDLESPPASSSGSGLFSVASPIDEDVHSDDDIMAASHATELSVTSTEAASDNSELAKLLAKVQSRLAAYE